MGIFFFSNHRLMETLIGHPPWILCWLCCDMIMMLVIMVWMVCVCMLVFHRVKHEFCFNLSRVFFFFPYQLRHKWRIWLNAFFKTPEFTIKCLLFTLLTWWLFLMGPLLEMNPIRTWCVIFFLIFFWFPFDKCLIRIFAYVHKLDFFFWVLFMVFLKLLSVLYWLFKKK